MVRLYLTTPLNTAIILFLIMNISIAIGEEFEERNDGLPEDVKMLPEQIGENAVTVVLLAAYNNTLPTFNITGTKVDGSNLIIEIYSNESVQGRENITIRTAYTTFLNLTCGNYSIRLLDNSTGDEIARENCTIKKMGEFLNDDNMRGVLGTYKGGMDNGTIYLMSFPTIPVCPPGLSKDTSFWANSSDRFYLTINLTNEGLDRSDVEVTLGSPRDGINITPGEAYIGRLTGSSSAFCIFQIGTMNIAHGIYNLTYDISYIEDGNEKSLKGIIPMGIYEKYEYCYEDADGNITANVKLLTPFNDYYNYTASEWIGINVSDSSANQKIWLPLETQMEINFSNYTMQEPNSPMPLFLVGAVAGGVVCGGATAFEQWMEKEPIDWNEISANAAKGAVGGAFIGATFGLAAPGAIGAKLGLTGADILRNTAILAAADTALVAGDEWAETGTIKWSNVVANGVLNAGESSILYGVGHVASAMTPAISHTLRGGGVGKWAKVSDLIKNGKFIDAALAYNSMATQLSPQIFHAVKTGYDTTHGILDLLEVFNSSSFEYVASHLFRDPTGDYLVKTNGEGGLFEGKDKSTDFSTAYSSDDNEQQSVSEMVCESSGIWTYVDTETYATGLGTQEVNWGVPEEGEKCGLLFTAYKQIPVAINQDFCLGEMTHFNWPTEENIQEAKLNLALHFITPMVSPDPQFQFDMSILTTTNEDRLSECDLSIQKSETPCDDLIIWTIGTPSQDFQIAEEDYTLRIVGFVDEWPGGSPVNRFATEERENSTAYLIGRIVPYDGDVSPVSLQPYGQLPAEDLLYLEDFSNPKSGWPRYSTDVEGYAYDDGRYTITMPNERDCYEFYPDVEFGDFVAEVETFMDEGDEWISSGLVFRYLDSENFYRFFISNEGEFRFDGIKDGDLFEIIDWTESGIIRQGDAINIIQVIANGGRFEFYVNGVKVADAFDRSFISGYIGLTGETDDDDGSQVSFDNLKIWDVVRGRPYGEISAGDILYGEDFTKNDGSWPEYSTENVGCAFSEGRYCLEIIPEETWFFETYSGKEFSDFVMELEATKEEGSDPVGYGVILRFIDDNNFYRFSLSSSGYFKFDGMQDGSWFTIIDWTESDIISTDESTNIIQVIAEGEKFTFFVNGKKVAEAYDSTLSTGRIGLVGETFDDDEAYVSFDNLNIWSLSE